MRQSLSSFLFLLFFISTVPTSCGQPTQPEAKITVDISAYPWLMPQYNMIQFYSRTAIEKFYTAWKSSASSQFSILHLGDSHLQSDIYPGQLRKKLHKQHGDAGRGLMFAFSTAKTYSSIEYNTEHTGSWTPQRSIGIAPKLPMGVRGMTCRTESLPATLTFTFVSDVPAHYNRLRIFCKREDSSYDLFVEAGGKLQSVAVEKRNDGHSYIEVEIPPIRDKVIKLHVVQKNDYEREFEFYGMSLESDRTHGVILHNAGVGAARYNSVLYQNLFAEQLPDFAADLVIIDFGTNDYLYDDQIKPELESEIRKVVALVRKNSPEASIILTTAQDLYWKNVNCRSGEAFADLIHKVAADTDCGVYDWYWIAGAQGSMLRWLQNSLSQPDMIHLNKAGYQLKGNLLFDAMSSSITWLDQNPDAKMLVLSTDELRAEQAQIRARIRPTKVPTSAKNKGGTVNSSPRPTTQTNARPTVPAKGKKHIHTVATGETISVIARRHGVSVSDIAKWNDLQSINKIYKGQKLVIFK